MNAYALEVKALSVLRTAKGRAQVEVALRYDVLVKKRIGVLSKELESMAKNSALALGSGELFRRAYVSIQPKTKITFP